MLLEPLLRHGFFQRIGFQLVEVAALEEAKGHFNRILVVSYDDSGLEKFVEGDDADAFVELPPGFAPSVTTDEYYAGTPSITPRADSRGSISSNQNRIFQAKKLRPFSQPSRSSDNERKGLLRLFKKRR